MLELNKIYNMDCMEGMKLIADNSIDSIVTDPPYELGFMGNKWDSTGIAYNVELWQEALRVLKPGGHLLAFGGTRTYHRMVCAIEDAGFEIRDCIQWLHSMGFPKSHDISKAIDKRAGAERKVIGKSSRHGGGIKGNGTSYELPPDIPYITAPATPEAQEWDGWGTALKPANEPIVLARKPLSEKTVAENVLKWGTGGLNIDGCRIPVGENELKPTVRGAGVHKTGNERLTGWNRDEYDGTYTPNEAGRFPANVILDEEAGKLLDEQSGNLKSGGTRPNGINKSEQSWKNTSKEIIANNYIPPSEGGASRFFYCAKASRKERNMGLEDVDPTTVDDGRNKPIDNPFLRGKTPRQNTHPTVKPVKLMEYLITLITPPNGIVLDPFFGSGTTGVAAVNLGFNYIGIELDEQYVEIARRRINAAREQFHKHMEVAK